MVKLRQGTLFHNLVALILGVTVGVIFIVFEWLVKDGTDYIWNDLFGSDEKRWLVLPLAIVLGVMFGWLLRLTKQKRLVPVETGFAETGAPKPVSFYDLVVIFVVGLMSLLAGASLGPEASLVSLCTGLGVWMAGKARLANLAQIMMLAGLGALLVAFFGALLLTVVPIFALKQSKKLTLLNTLPIVIAALGAYLTIYVLKGDVHGWGGIPAGTHFSPKDYLLAFTLGILTALATGSLKGLIKFYTPITRRLYNRLHWAWAAAAFGGVIGILYLLGGESVQFNGSAGSGILVSRSATYGTLTLLSLAIIKLLVTAWSLAAGYRGGLVFPSVYVGVALSLFVGSLASGLGGAGTMVGAIAGIFASMTTPAVGLIMMISLLPLKMIGLAAFGVAGATLGRRLRSSSS